MSVVERERVEEVAVPQEVTVGDVLERAADLLEEFGWCQGRIGATKGGFCALGALIQADHDLHTGETNVRRFVSSEGLGAFSELCRGFSVATWNNAPDRTREEVVTALRNAAEKART